MQTSPLGALLTFAQHKGYALATLCEVLGGALSGGRNHPSGEPPADQRRRHL